MKAKPKRRKNDALDQAFACRVLSFDTSTSQLHIALSLDGQPLAEDVILANPNSGAPRQEVANLLMPAIDRLTRASGWSKQDIDCLVVGTGPGSFTGIRTSVVTARALAQALELPLIPVSLLQCYAAQVETPAAIVLKAKAGSYFLATVTDDCLKSFYLDDQQLGDALAQSTVVYADSQTVAAAKDEASVWARSPHKLRELPSFSNIAKQQSQLAWNWLSLKISALYEKLNKCTANGSGEERERRRLAREELRRHFPYELVTPTYLRAPSVTIKKEHA